jgi:hypothetical protein
MLCAGGDVAVRWLLSFLYVEGAVWKELVRWLAARRAAPEPVVMMPSARAASGVKQSVNLAKISGLLWLCAIMMLPKTFLSAFLCVLLFWIIAVALRWPQRRLSAAREHRALLAKLSARLEREGAHRLEAGDPLRVAVERRFWREQQGLAAAALQQRIAGSADLSSNIHVPLVWMSARSYWLVVIGLGLVPLLSIGVAAWQIPLGLYNISQFMEYFVIHFGLRLGGVLFVVMVLESLQTIQREFGERDEIVLKRRRIADMAELAGGLTLASADDMLVGALSGEVAQGGELEQAGEGA